MSVSIKQLFSNKIFLRIKALHNKTHPLLRFAVYAFLLFVVWTIFYKFFRYGDQINKYYNILVFHSTNAWLYTSQFVLSVMGFESVVSVPEKAIKLIGDEGNLLSWVILERGCLGRNLIGIFAGFIIAFPGKIVSKLWYIPIGLVVFYLLNTVRIVALVLVLHYNPERAKDPDFFHFHHDGFNYVMYGFIFILWVIWVRKYSSVATTKTKEKSQQQPESSKKQLPDDKPETEPAPENQG